jgi:hypothetical protein
LGPDHAPPFFDAFSSREPVSTSLENAIADCALRRAPLHPTQSQPIAVLQPQTEQIMRAEVERLVEEIKQSVGLLRRHL